MKEESLAEANIEDRFKVLVNPGVYSNNNPTSAGIGNPVPASPANPVSVCPKDGETDEVDGLVEDILVPISKMGFLKIIFIDIGITVGNSHCFIRLIIHCNNIVFNSLQYVQDKLVY